MHILVMNGVIYQSLLLYLAQTNTRNEKNKIENAYGKRIASRSTLPITTILK